MVELTRKSCVALFPLWSLKKWSGKLTQTTGTYEQFKK